MDNRLREIEQWVAEARDGLGDGGREAYVRKLYLLDAEIRAVIKDSGILPQADSPRPAISLVRRLSSLALPVASALVVLAVSTAYLRGGAPMVQAFRLVATADRQAGPQNWHEYLAVNGEVMVVEASSGRTPGNSEFSILTARPDGAQQNTPPAGPSSTPRNADEPVEAPARQQIVLAKANTPPQAPPVAAVPEGTGSPATKPASDQLPAANESTSVASGSFILASYTPPAVAEPAAAKPQPKKEENRKASPSVEQTDSEPVLNEAELAALLASKFERR